MPRRSEEPADATGEQIYNDGRLISVLSRFVKVDRVSGDPVTQARFDEVEPPAQAVALMLYRHVAESLGQLDGAVPVEGAWLAEHTGFYATEVAALREEFPFVEAERGDRYFVPRSEIGAAVEFLAGLE